MENKKQILLKRGMFPMNKSVSNDLLSRMKTGKKIRDFFLGGMLAAVIFYAINLDNILFLHDKYFDLNMDIFGRSSTVLGIYKGYVFLSVFGFFWSGKRYIAAGIVVVGVLLGHVLWLLSWA